MTWVKIDDRMYLNPKVRDVSLAARWTYIASICRSGETHSDGDVRASDLGLLDANQEIADELVTAGLWETTSRGSWCVHDYLKYNRSWLQIQESTKVNKANGQKGLANRYANRYTNGLANGVANGLANARSVLSENSEAIEEQERLERASEPSGKPASESLGKPLAPLKKTVPTEEWALEMREKYRLRDFDETLKFFMNGSYYRGCADKCQYLEGKLKAASERERGMNPIANQPVGQNVTAIHERNLELERIAIERKANLEVKS